MSGAGLWYAAAASGPKKPKQVILTSGTSWPVPSDWNNAKNKAECIGAGSRGGGAYALKNNLVLTPGTSISYQIGTQSGTQTATDTWLVSTATVKAVGSIGTAGGAAASCVGDVKHSGGDGTSSGGGGAAGPNGDGLPAVGSSGGAGDAGFGGAGGTSGNPGQPGTEWGTAGSGGGSSGSTGSGGGLYGGGDSKSAAAPGLIVITYTPT